MVVLCAWADLSQRGEDHGMLDADLADKLLVGVMVVLRECIRYEGCEEAVNGSQHGQHEAGLRDLRPHRLWNYGNPELRQAAGNRSQPRHICKRQL